MKDTPEIEASLLAFVRNELVGPDVAIDRNDELLTGEILDSIAVVRLAGFVESQFGLDMKPGDFVIENFKSIAVLAAFVRSSRGAGPIDPIEPDAG